MKVATLCFAGFFGFLLFANFKFSPRIPLNDGLIRVYFSANQNIGDLVKIKDELTTKNIYLNYKKLEFNTDGHLSKISYEVKAKKFGAADDADNLDEEIGFIINTSSKPTFGIMAGKRNSIEARCKILQKE